jgi:multidrug resistance protein MdtO
MVVATTLVMIVCMAYRIPYAWQAATYALLVSRESSRSTIKSAATLLLITVLSTSYILLSIHLFINNPAFHFVWTIVTLFVAFYAITAQRNYLAAVAFVNTVSIAIPLWDRHLAAEANVEDMVRLCLAVLMAVTITSGVEMAYLRWWPGSDILSSIAAQLSSARDVLSCYSRGCPADPAIERELLQLGMVKASALRRTLQRSNYSRDYVSVMAAVSGLVGRVVDLVGALTQVKVEWTAKDRSRLHNIATALTDIRYAFLNQRIPARIQFDPGEDPAAAAPLLGEIEQVVSLIPLVCLSPQLSDEYAPLPDHLPQSTLLASDAFTNLEHIRFALKGCLAAGACYVIYNAIAWPGISTAVTTCLLTALSTVGASHQKQILRIAGAIVGGFGLGMGAQLFILPYVDSIAGFVVLFVFVTALSSWFMTSSSRLSYFGVQVALAFYLVHLQEFTFQNSLAVGRDRVVGILLGLFVMWLVFDRLWGGTAAVEMRAAFISTVRSLAQLAKGPVSRDIRDEIGRSLALRETINGNLDKVSAQADGVLFELGPSRERDLQLRTYVRRWQPQLRALFLMRIALLKYRLQLRGFELPEPLLAQLETYDSDSSRMLEEMADWIGRNEPQLTDRGEAFAESPTKTAQRIAAAAAEQLPPGRAQSFISLLRGVDEVTTVLASEIMGCSVMPAP